LELVSGFRDQLGRLISQSLRLVGKVIQHLEARVFHSKK
jgi:hypothetical protein